MIAEPVCFLNPHDLKRNLSSQVKHTVITIRDLTPGKQLLPQQIITSDVYMFLKEMESYRAGTTKQLHIGVSYSLPLVVLTGCPHVNLLVTKAGSNSSTKIA